MYCQEFVDLLNLKPGQKVLDVGCGIGGGDFYMAKVRAAKSGLSFCQWLNEMVGRNKNQIKTRGLWCVSDVWSGSSWSGSVGQHGRHRLGEGEKWELAISMYNIVNSPYFVGLKSKDWLMLCLKYVIATSVSCFIVFALKKLSLSSSHVSLWHIALLKICCHSISIQV